ncbi:hypothetical protein GCM10029976_030280 [Kribbella albertanoniae]|uniref:hypothetical protein n=1 Tax=Kribbella albertanoniae TaxID=1266829 RepID=UPI00192D885A|nr:hypothetical protein [Kribbella albertanoniae]
MHKLTRQAVSNASPDQPAVWTLLEFEVDDDHAVALAEALQQALEQPGWYADFHNDHEIFVVFPARTFRYPRGDQPTRAKAQSHGRSLAIPEPQLDWTD